jgi:hypothetical protein
VGGASITLNAWGGPVRNTGALTSIGAATLLPDVQSGTGGGILLSSRSGELVSNATLISNGGASPELGGAGGQILFVSSGDSNDSPPSGSIHVSGDLRVNGADSAISGAGGSVLFVLSPAAFQHGEEIELLGYSQLSLNGGASTDSYAGSGGSVQFQTAASTLYNSLRQPGGAVINTANISARGGAGPISGSGGAVSFATQSDYSFATTAEFVSNSGAIDLSGGDSGNEAASGGGSINFFSEGWVHNTGALTVNGGTASGGPNGGGYGGQIDLTSNNGLVENAGPLRANGGSGTLYGGHGGDIQARGQALTNSAALSATGANSAGTAGNGGYIYLLAGSGFTANTGTLTVTPGTGATASGDPGSAVIDGVPVP